MQRALHSGVVAMRSLEGCCPPWDVYEVAPTRRSRIHPPVRVCEVVPASASAMGVPALDEWEAALIGASLAAPAACGALEVCRWRWWWPLRSSGSRRCRIDYRGRSRDRRDLRGWSGEWASEAPSYARGTSLWSAKQATTRPAAFHLCQSCSSPPPARS